jgi:O-antigen/teichoic acid export membrane protein
MPREPNSSLYKVITRAIGTISCKEKLKQVLDAPLYTNAMYLVADMATTALLGFVFWIVVARFYNASDVGFATAILSVAMFLATLSYLGFDAALIRFLPSADKPDKLLNTSFTLCGVVGLLLGTLFLLGLPLWSPVLGFLRNSAISSVTFVILVALLTLSGLVGSSFVAQRQARFTFFTNITSSVLKIPLAILLAGFFYSLGIVGAFALAAAVAIVIGISVFLPKVMAGYRMLPELKTSLIKDVWRYSGANYLASLLFGASRWLLPVIVLNVLGPDANAYFYMAFTMASLLFILPFAVSGSLFAEGSHFEDKLGENVIKSLKFTFLILVPGVILLLLAGKWLLLLFGESYSANALHLLWLMSLSSLPLSINSIYSTVLRVTGRLKELIIIWGLTAIGVLVGSYFIIPISGITGVGYALLGTYTLVTVYVLSTRRLPFR